jgi:hypothetical protein
MVLKMILIWYTSKDQSSLKRKKHLDMKVFFISI